jgi:Flp pilus assembly protein TadD
VVIEPDNSGGWANLGITLLSAGHREEARRALETALKLNPQSRAALTGLAKLSSESGDKQKAQEYLERIPK